MTRVETAQYWFHVIMTSTVIENNKNNKKEINK